MEKLVADVTAVLDHFNQTEDGPRRPRLGGFIAWTFAMTHPDKVDRLVVLNLPHPNGLMCELASNPEQRRNSSTTTRSQQQLVHKALVHG